MGDRLGTPCGVSFFLNFVKFFLFFSINSDYINNSKYGHNSSHIKNIFLIFNAMYMARSYEGEKKN